MGTDGTSDGDTGSAGRLPVRPPKPGKAMSIFVLLVGLGIVGVGAYSYVADSASLENRVEVTAEITDTDVEAVPGSRGRQQYIPTPTYQYDFRGTVYTSEMIFPGEQPRYDDRATAEARLSAYTVGETVTAYVDPDAPGEAFLEDSRSGLATGAFFAGVVVCLVGGIGLRQARVESRARNRSL